MRTFLLLSFLAVASSQGMENGTRVELEGASCWKEECRLGSLITDSMRFCGMYEFMKTRNPGMGDMDIISLWNSGSMARRDFTHSGEATIATIQGWLGGDRGVSFVVLTGSQIKRILKLSATALETPSMNFGNFLHVSANVRVTYRGASFREFTVLCDNCEDKEWKPLDDEYNYHVVMPSTGLLDLESTLPSSDYHYALGMASECIQLYLGHMPDEFTEENISDGRIRIESGFGVDEELPMRCNVDVQVPTSGLEIALLSITVALLFGLMLLGLLNFFFGRNQTKFQLRDSFSSTAGLTPYNTNKA